FMPFITEELHSKLPGAGETISKEAYPDGGAVHAAEAARMEGVMDVIRAIRNIRTDMNVAQNLQTDCLCISGSDTMRQTLSEGEEYIRQLAKVKSLAIRESGERPRDAVSAIAAAEGGGVEIFVPLSELVDVEVETKRLAKELEKLASELEGVRKKLSNESFTAKAPADVVEKERARLTALLEKKAKLEAGLERIRGIKG
ncbi:MAG: class I tRNA ligase family protein, partial [Deltaproteobacteria bacterium]|nr:class I tRNA ligase family protein [Deltaproteobacteria bacterium]